MRQIKDIPLFVGVKEQYTIARSKGMKIVCALNRALKVKKGTGEKIDDI